VVGGRGGVGESGAGGSMGTAAWQGLSPSVAPADSANPDVEPCGAGLYDGPAGSPCVNDLCRRTVTTVVRISDLTPA